MIPLLRPVFLSAFIVLAHLAIKSYDLVVALTSGGPGGSAWLPSNFMYEYTFKRNEMAVGSASAVIMLIAIAASSCPISIPNCASGCDDRRDAARDARHQPEPRGAVSAARRDLHPARDLRRDLPEPLFVMLVTSFKTMPEIQDGNMLALPQHADPAPWARAWGEACVGLTCAGIKGYFWNSIKMVVPAVAISTFLGALNGYVLTKWRFKGHKLVFGLMLFACFIPFQSVLLPMATVLGNFGRFGTTLEQRSAQVSVSATRPPISSSSTWSTASASPRCSSATTTKHFPTELVRAAMVDGAGFFQIFRRILLPNSLPIIVVCVIYQFTNIWNDFLFASAYAGRATRCR